MASCTKIDGLLQAYIDEELGASERVILDQHVSECPGCARLLKRQQRSSAALFEAYSRNRLTRDLSRHILDHLPELETAPEDFETLNWRAKHPGRFGGRMRHFVPAAAAVLLVVLGAVIRENWPVPIPLMGQIGMVAYVQGDTNRVDPASGKVDGAVVEAGVYPGDRYESSDASGLMVSLDGATHIKMDENSRIRIDDARTITVEKGQIYLDVGTTDRIFQVATLAGNITVFGTRFSVSVADDSTFVAVEEGEVQVEHRYYGSFATLHRGQVVDFRRGDDSLVPREGDVASLTRWATLIRPSADMLELLAKRYPRADVSDAGEANRFFYREYYLKNLNHQRLDSIVLSWDQDSVTEEDYCGYHVYVYTDVHEPIFRGRVDGSVFSNPTSSRFELLNDSSVMKTSRFGWVRLVPDLADGLREMESIRVSGKTGTNEEMN